jgi:hypothetical protein
MRFRAPIAFLLWLAVRASGGMGWLEVATADEPKPAESPLPPAADSETLKILLMDGSQIGGKLAAQQIEIDTQFGKLTVPVSAIISLTPGFGSHPHIGQNINELVEKLGSPVFSEREAAQKALAAMGPAIRVKVAHAAEDADTERRTRVKAILEEFDQADEDSESEDSQPVAARRMIDRDTVETTDFTVVGKIVPQEFQIASHYGVLNVKLSDIRRIQRDVAEKQDLQKTIAVDGNSLITRTMKDSGLRVQRGDKLTFAADGTVTMIPWGNQAISTPDGAPNYGWYLPNKIAGGALVGKIGANGPVFRVGSKHTMTADRSGTLQLAIAVQGDPNNQVFPGEYRVKVRVKRK